MTPLSAVVAGAGIGGLAAALALSARGVPVTLLERRTSFSEPGAGIQLSPNASRVLLGLGLGPALRRAGTEPERVVVRRIGSGRQVGEVRLGAFMRERFGAPYLVVHRADLHTILLDAARSRSGIRLLFGREVVGGDARGDRAQLTVTKAGGGEEQHEADLLIAADGIWSAASALASKVGPPAYGGASAWRATLPREAAPAELRGDETGLWLGRGAHVVHYPIAGGRRINLVAVRDGPAQPGGWATPVEPGEVVRAFAGAVPLLRALVAAAEGWTAWPLLERPAVRMAEGRAALLGDAAHPVLPYLAQGGALAIEDAAVLAACLDGSDVPGSLKAYERARLARVRRVQRAARGLGRIYHAGFPVALARDWGMGWLGPERMSARYAWLYGWRPEAG